MSRKLVTQPSLLPTRKVTGAMIGAATAVLLRWVLGKFGISMEQEVADALSVILTGAGGWLLKEYDLGT